LTLQEHIENYIEHPFPLWDNELTKLLVANKWHELSTGVSLNEQYNYNITNSITKGQHNDEFMIPLLGSNIQIAIPTLPLQSFYKEHGLKTTDFENDQLVIIAKINSALAVIQSVPEAFLFINQLVKSVQLIEAEYTDTDTSYSHPDIPFSIFFSVCEEDSIISNLRVAESILHEAMHLKLTLIESHIHLIVPNSKEVFYSPWRDEERPLRGVLHGLFVFRAILDFYNLLAKEYSNNSIEMNYLKSRIEEIERDFEALKTFPNCHGLTVYGKPLVEKLLKKI
jgi:hypothetical protein